MDFITSASYAARSPMPSLESKGRRDKVPNENEEREKQSGLQDMLDEQVVGIPLSAFMSFTNAIEEFADAARNQCSHVKQLLDTLSHSRTEGPTPGKTLDLSTDDATMPRVIAGTVERGIPIVYFTIVDVKDFVARGTDKVYQVATLDRSIPCYKRVFGRDPFLHINTCNLAGGAFRQAVVRQMLIYHPGRYREFKKDPTVAVGIMVPRDMVRNAWIIETFPATKTWISEMEKQEGLEP